MGNCNAACRDGTSCLNKARYEGYCSKHQDVAKEEGSNENQEVRELENSAY